MIRQSLPFFANFRRQLIQTCYMLEGGGGGQQGIRHVVGAHFTPTK